jgi:hypothetical protein
LRFLPPDFTFGLTPDGTSLIHNSDARLAPEVRLLAFRGTPVEPIQIPLTEEQQQLIRRPSGQFAQVLELVPDATDSAAGAGRTLQFRWRLSVATGIPRQQWGPGPAASDSPSESGQPA